MKYLEQDDDLIGYRYGENSGLEVLGWWQPIKEKKRPRTYRVKCHTCAKTDVELYGVAEYRINKHQILKGTIPCGCSSHPVLTTEQNKIIIKRICKSRGYTVEFPDNKIQSATKLSLTCSCGNRWRTNLNRLKSGIGCRVCGNIQAGMSKTKSDDEIHKTLIRKGNFTINHKFRRVSKSRDRNIEVTCPFCSNDEMTAAGLCNGIFLSSYSNLISGKIPCRCSDNYKYSKEQREYLIANKILNDNLPYKFNGWIEDFSGAFTKFSISCETHGEWVSNPDSFVTSGTMCPSCSKTGYSTQKTGFLYVLAVIGINTSFVGYGISNIPQKRISTHEKSFESSCHTITDKCVFKMSGSKALGIESEIKYRFPRHSQDITGFRTEATYINLYDDVVNFVRSFGVEEIDGDLISSTKYEEKSL